MSFFVPTYLPNIRCSDAVCRSEFRRLGAALEANKVALAQVVRFTLGGTSLSPRRRAWGTFEQRKN